jgi:Uma2 family endonuclease
MLIAEPRYTVEQFLQMFEYGLLPDAASSELLEGQLVIRSAKSPCVTTCLVLAHEAIHLFLPTDLRVRIQSSIRTGDSLAEPTLAVVRGVLRDYVDRHPGPDDTPLVVEISDTSLRQDRTLKARVYARAGIPVYWIINVVDSQIEVHTDPTGSDPLPCYRTCVEYRNEDEVPVVIDGQEIGRIAAKDVLP